MYHVGDVTRVISIHALREEGDRLRGLWSPPWYLFLSTPSARRATFGNDRVAIF